MNIPFVVETVLHDGLLKYKFKNSKIRSITTKPGKSKGAIFAYRSKKSMIGGRGVVLTSEEAIHENQDTFTHWTPNVYRYGTYADENRSYTKGHSENNLRQINTFFIDFDIHTAKETISASDILTTAIDLGFMPTLIIKSDKGYQAYFVLETPVYVTSKSEFKSVKAAKIISQNIREYFGKSLPVDLTCNHFGIARIPRTDNVEFFDPNYRYSFKEWQDWSFKQTDNKGFTRSSLTVLSGTEGKKQVDEPWFNLLLHETKFSGEKGLIGRNNVMFTLSLAYFSSGYSIETCEYNMFEFNNRLDQPLEEKEVIKLVRSAYSENYQGATLLRPDGKTMFYLHSIGMLPNYQDKGYGSKLLSFIKEYSKEIGCSEMFLITDKGNPRACHVYEKLGGKNDYKDEIVYVYDYEKGDK